MSSLWAELAFRNARNKEERVAAIKARAASINFEVATAAILRDLSPAELQQHIQTMQLFHQVKEQRAMRITSQVNTLNEYRAAFFVKALRQLARKVGLELGGETTAQSVSRLLEHVYHDRYYSRSPLSTPSIGYLNFTTKDGKLLRSTLDPIQLFHVFESLARTPHTMAQELDTIGEHALRVIRHTVDYGLGETLKALVKESI